MRGRFLAVLALLLAALATTGCREVHVPGKVKRVALRVAFANLPQSELSGIGSFSVVFVAGGIERQGELLFSASARKFEWHDEPDDLPTTGRLDVRMRAKSLAGSPLAIGGTAGPLDLDAVAPSGEAELRVLISRLDAFAPLAAQLARPRFLHTATLAPGGGLLIVGGAGGGTPPAAPQGWVAEAEWIDPFSGSSCTSGGAGLCRGWGEVPLPRVHHVAVRLSDGFAADCPMADRIFVALGEDAAKAALSDAYLFDAAKLDGSGVAFERLANLGLTPRIGAVALPTRACQVVIAGGHAAGSTTPIREVEIVTFRASGPQMSLVPAPLPGAANHMAAFRLDNGLDEMVLVGGQADGGVAAGVALTLSTDSGTFEACDLSSAGCNGAVGAPLCARASPVAARLGPAATTLSPALIVGAPAAPCTDVAEVFRSSTKAPFAAFLRLAPQPSLKWVAGHTATSVAAGSVLIAGGVESSSSAPTAAAARFVLGGGLSEDSTVAEGSFVALQPMGEKRAFHSAVSTGQQVVLIGGWDGTRALAGVEVYGWPF